MVCYQKPGVMLLCLLTLLCFMPLPVAAGEPLPFITGQEELRLHIADALYELHPQLEVLVPASGVVRPWHAMADVTSRNALIASLLNTYTCSVEASGALQKISYSFEYREGARQAMTSLTSAASPDEVVEHIQQAVQNRVERSFIEVPQFCEKAYHIDNLVSQIDFFDAPLVKMRLIASAFGRWARRAITYTIIPATELKGTILHVQILFEPEDLEERVREIVGEIVSPDTPDYEVVLRLHDYVVNTVDYVEEGGFMGVWSSYTAIMEGTAVCSGYAQALLQLLTVAGVEATIAVGDVIGGGGHAWNMVRVQGDWYHLDATWNDTAKPGEITYRYYNVTDRFMERSRTWTKSDHPASTATAFNYRNTMRMIASEDGRSKVPWFLLFSVGGAAGLGAVLVLRRKKGMDTTDTTDTTVNGDNGADSSCPGTEKGVLL